MIAATTTETFLDFEGLLPTPYLVLLGVGIVTLIVLAYLRTFRAYGRRFIALLVALRLVAIAFLVLSLAKPIWRIRTVRFQRGQVAVIVDDSRSMLHKASEHTRYADLEGLLAGTTGPAATQAARREGLIDALRRTNDVRLFDIAGRAITGLPRTPGANRTDIGRAVEDTVKHLKHELVAAVVLVSDGTDTTGRDVLERVGGVAYPIYCVGLGDPKADRKIGGDVRIAGVDANQRVLRNNTVAVKVRLQAHGIEERDVAVKIMRGKSLVAGPAYVDLKPAGDEVAVDLEFQPTTAGHFIYSAVVSPEFKGDRKANNVWHFPLTVRQNMIQIMYVEGALRWEHKFLRRALQDDPDLIVQSFTRTGPRTKWRGTGAKGLRGSIFRPDVLKSFNVVVLGDIESSYFTPGELETLVQFVEAEKAGGLLLLGGYLAYGDEGFTKGRFSRLLPAVFPKGQNNQIERPFQLALTREGVESPIFRVFSDPAANAVFWRSLPPLEGCAKVLRAKKGATILAVNPTVDTAGGKMPVAVTQRFGHGRVLLFTPDTSWKWRQALAQAGLDVSRYNRLWSQMIRWLAGAEPRTDKPPLEVVTSKYKYGADENVKVTVTVNPPPAESKATGPLRPALLQGCGGEVSDVALEPVTAPDGAPKGTLAFRGEFKPAGGGRHVVVAEGYRAGELVEMRHAELLVERADVEMDLIKPDHRLLAQLARRTGGAFYTVADAGDLVPRIKPIYEEKREPDRKEKLWNSPVFFAGFLICMFVEWFLRRRRRMA